MKKAYQILAAFLSIGILGLLSLIIYAQISLPDYLFVEKGEDIYINRNLSLVAIGEERIPILAEPSVYDSYGNSYRLDLKLFQSLPIKQVQVQVVPRKMVVPGGVPFGIKMRTAGVIIVGMTDIQNGTENLNPAKDAGLKMGDVILSIDDVPIAKNNDVAERISQSQGNEIKVHFMRDGEDMEVYLQPVRSDFEEDYRAGMWVRDTSAGIGTLTYYKPDSMAFAGLGHAICDVDTGRVMPLSKGEIVNVHISGANAGYSGKPGELKGSFVGLDPIGYLAENCEKGIYGVLEKPISFHDPVPIAMKQEIQTGPATILTTISGSQPQSFDIVIEKVSYADNYSVKNMVIKVVDPKLLATTGGIVQGMSGSPILQDGKLVGAVTHVFVNDPTRGYGIFAENMEEQIENIEKSQKRAD